MEIQQIKKFYDEQTTRKIKDFINGNVRVDCAWQSLLSLLRTNPPVNILEIGCGIGSISWLLAKQFPNASVTGFDISEKSITISKQVFRLPNLQFVVADDITLLPVNAATPFDLIIMMDVYEHIPRQQRVLVSNFIKQTISKKGILFISCPTPRHLAYLKQYQPGEIQPVDEDITIAHLMQLATDINTPITYYKEVDVWRKGDYFHAALSNTMDLSPVSHSNAHPIQLNLKRQVLQKIKAKFNKKYYKRLKAEAKQQRRKMVTEALGENFES